MTISKSLINIVNLHHNYAVESIYHATKIPRLFIRDTDPQGKLYGSPHLRECVAASYPY